MQRLFHSPPGSTGLVADDLNILERNAVLMDDRVVRGGRHVEASVPTCHVMVSMALTNQRRSSQGRKTSYGDERAVDLSTARLSGPWTNPRPARKTSKGRC